MNLPLIRTLLRLGLAALLCPSLTLAQVPAAAEALPHWIWHPETTSGQEVVLRKTFELRSLPQGARLAGTCDNHMIVLVNGQRVAEHGQWERVAQVEVGAHLKAGENTLEVRALNEGGPAGLALRLELGGERVLVTDGSWGAALPGPARRGWFGPVDVQGPVGQQGLPWSGTVTAASFAGDLPTFALPVSEDEQGARPADELNLLPGFRAELLYAVPGERQGSWVALGQDDRGRLYTSDQAGKGLYRITPPALGDPAARTRVEKVPVDVSGAQGLCWAFDSLYANVNGQGLWRLRDTDGDDLLDHKQLLVPLGNGGEHGPHAVLPSPDGTGLHFLAGNHTLPPEFEGSAIPANWGEDLLLPRLWDANGHARGRVAPGGWIARCDPDGGNVRMLSVGYRNQFDMAWNDAGELFSYDADMEWDMGTPWYRPTRLVHATSGSEFGWRGGTGKWPAHYEDSLPPVLDIGPGSPTGIVFGTGARFPARYQRALFVLDWTFGTIYALHLEPDGASYTATKEDFAWGRPWGVTDAVVGQDGALYVTTGGRGSRSYLYRLVYEGPESTEPVPAVTHDAGFAKRAIRRTLEDFHGRQGPAAVRSVWPYLGDADRYLRYAARVALESQPVEGWRALALAESEPLAAAVALIALARQGGPQDLEPVLEALLRLDLAALPEPVQLVALRAYALAFVRLGEGGQPSDASRTRVIAQLDPLLPSGSHALDQELVRVLAHLQAPSVVPKGLDLMLTAGTGELPPWTELIGRNERYGSPIQKLLADPPPIQGLAYALLLRHVTEGWTPERRRAYFGFFVDASRRAGGNSYGGFLRNIRADAAGYLSVAQARSLADVLEAPLLAPPPKDVTPPKGPGRAWTVEGALTALGGELRGRSFAAGRNLFHATQCSTCHRFDGAGGAIGPDLSTVANKYALRDLLEHVIEPSRVIADQYGSHLLVDTDGRSYDGILVEGTDADGTELLTLYPREAAAEPLVFTRDEVDVLRESKLSQMPEGLVDPLNPEELRDLVAYLLSGGNRKAKVFTKD